MPALAVSIFDGLAFGLAALAARYDFFAALFFAGFTFEDLAFEDLARFAMQRLLIQVTTIYPPAGQN